MYLSRVEIDVNNHQKIQDLNHLGAYHNWVEQSFPDEVNASIRTRKLWRVDELNHKKYLLIVSENMPVQAKLEHYGIPGSSSIIDYGKFIEKLKNGMHARFRAVLNPAVSKSTGKKSGQRGKVYECLSLDSQMQYLYNRADKNGFDISDGEYMVKHSSSELLVKSNRPCYIKQVAYEGRLVIKDIDKFKAVLTEGLGRKKAYGCGMFTIIPE
ncbi:type I-E CRISPR-associated protein Cas6/Cse3/CasE [Apilactobacillus xinyiensis]|uniref:type I-E CRISPR-associated protein Cas6/Cse3/CasE n=1 Tax=Apilactobacillus xinyiensis TaxID=2841032 RepID=UPI001C7D8816|nr:type I-E CRISPR-associated protein Cas6/Cse3/CasE [Apilactobacillus xinyiensis]MCL0319227.1 type I-E CRISPR-associated protein Cas6/Cse3/CasE [Apilactobacillus xinyiensis]